MAMAMERLGTLNTTAPTGCVALFSDASIRSRRSSITKSSRCRGIRLECGRLRIGRRNFHVVKCESGPDDGEKDGKNGKSSASTATEDGEDETKPSSSSHQPPQNGFQQAGPKTVQLDAFRFMELVGPEKVDPEDVKLLKDKVFGYTTFWVTGQEPFGVLGEGILFLGNLRGQREEVFAKLQKGVRELIGNKYDLFMVEEPNSEEPDPRGGPRVSFLLLRKEASDAGRTGLWQYVVAAVLFFITAGACLQLGFATQLQVSKLPPEIVQYFTNPESTEPPDLDLLVPYVESALPLAYGVFGVQLFHEIGHRLAAAPLGVKLGIPYFIPNITLGSFGAITQFKSICPDRKAKFDVSMAGPLAGGFLSVAMVGVGLLLSAKGAPEGTLVQVPSVVFQGSFLLGLVARAALGYDVLHAGTVAVHPLVIAGWCGLTTTAFNLLPVGCIDGGRALQAAFGSKVLNIAGLITYVLLGLGVLGGPLSLPWGLYIIIVQRSSGKACLKDVTGVGTWRQIVYAVTLVLVVLTLLPLWDGLATQLGIGIGTPDSLDLFM
ncbi:probable zinc metalloprotease EGY1, chloroplastic isoform X2 [Selaginella moellendorffii]|uniref:probable zinc metalloprotease EGY1, chloroplastic isoform X2 n=1 Tax=Selaginella moellendorffii TaxID=88036 RepID=UPI000D1D0114|nr:probable zinc metalloprotease EGY1, chloroplastic isoform X2 [Selaginella moellendorffii]|eukprot:XP_024541734.1 probable zinc metalloprotease EGY1, chloroplastic isoform X2 [Selaginella moellendorffii]